MDTVDAIRENELNNLNDLNDLRELHEMLMRSNVLDVQRRAPVW